MLQYGLPCRKPAPGIALSQTGCHHQLRSESHGFISSPGEMRIFPATHAHLATTLFVLGIVLGSVKPSRAGIACPVMLYGGKVDQGTVSVSFMNRGKAPIRELELNCTPLQGYKAKRSECHTEDGVFFPGTSYTISFSYPGKTPRTMSLSLKTALLSDGVRWTSIHDQPCKSLKITNR